MRIALLLLLMMSMSPRLFAAEAWAYCNGSNRAYLSVKRFVQDCPNTSGRPGEPARNPEPIDPELCTSRAVMVAVNHPELDYICAYPTAAEAGEDVVPNTFRCLNGDKKHCQLGAGGVDGPGDHSVPVDGWWAQKGVSSKFPFVKCQCGCFVGETLISSPSGHLRIDALAEQSKIMPVGVLQFSQSNGVTASEPLRGRDFTVGPETKPVIRIATASGLELSVTDIHPIFVLRGNSMTMIQAKNLEAGELLMDENGNIDAVLSLESYRLDLNANKVYNLDTRSADPEEHVISANRILVGDLHWQKRLSEESDRAQNILNAAQRQQDEEKR